MVSPADGASGIQRAFINSDPADSDFLVPEPESETTGTGNTIDSIAWETAGSAPDIGTLEVSDDTEFDSGSPDPEAEAESSK